jgi:hypothetical protein
MDTELSRQSPAKLPAMPEISPNLTESQRLPIFRHYQEELVKYFPELQKSVDQVSAICDRAQSKAGSLDTAGADPAAADLAAKYQSLIDHRQQLAVQMAGLAAQQLNEVQGGRISSLGLRLVAAGTEALFSASGAGLATATDDLEAKGSEKNQGGKEFAGIQRAILEWRRDASATAAARTDLLKTLQTNYPKQDWSFLSR